MDTHRPLLSRTFDVAVFGGGYAGFAAVQRVRAAGRSCLWFDRQAAPLWEGGWAGLVAAGTSDLAEWAAWCGPLSACGGMQDGRIDGAIAEIHAAAVVRDQGWDWLGYAAPLAAEVADGVLVGVLVGGKSGIQRVSAARWIDTTDDGELVRLLGAVPAAPLKRTVAATLRHADWATVSIPGLLPGVWPDERRLEVNLAPGEAVSDGLLRALPAELGQAVLTHAAVVPLGAWQGGQIAPGLPRNLINAVPAFSTAALGTLAARFAHGHAAAAQVLAAPAAVPRAPDAPLPVIAARELPPVDVAVAGLGTGGALGALAAGRAGATVAAFDPLPFAGGIGSGGGIHHYYYGMKGGLQDVLDERVRALMPRFVAGGQIQGFHPDAKKAALAQLLTEAGVRPLVGTLVSVERHGRDIRSALVATPEGPVRITAKAWIDGTGDGDLCARAGCAARFGRAGDGLPHAYSQPTGTARLHEGKVRMGIINFDQGYTDPTDVADLSRARIAGIAQYVRASYADGARPNYVAPAIGLRQARHVVTRATLELADLIERRRFPDAIGYTGCHYDNHASDLEAESDEAAFWVWGCRGWWVRTACEMPYGIIVPRDVDNAWIACRALGVSQDAHHSLRMQRDMQRIGEVAGLAAAQHAAHGAVDLPRLRADLQASGALELRPGEDVFGAGVDATWFADALTWLGDADWAVASRVMWRLYRSGDRAALHALVRGPAPDETAWSRKEWRATVVLAALGDAAVRPRLWQAFTAREDGFADWPEERHPQRWNRQLPAWRQALVFLRWCGTAEDIVRLEEGLRGEELHWSLAMQLATTVERIAGRDQSSAQAPAVRAAGAALLDRCAAATAGAARDPQANPNHITAPLGAIPPHERRPVREDATWQLQCAVARARHALGLAWTPPTELAGDDRLLVRRAYDRLAALAPAVPAGSATAAAAR